MNIQDGTTKNGGDINYQLCNTYLATCGIILDMLLLETCLEAVWLLLNFSCLHRKKAVYDESLKEK